jgi:hypothetical protein
MFSKISAALLLLALTTLQAGAEIDFTPTETEYSAEGFTYRKITLKDGEGRVNFTPPHHWVVRGDKDRMQLTSPNKSFVEATIQGVPLSALQRFDEAAVKAFEEQAIRAAPPGSQSVQIVKREENPVVMGQNLSFGVVISYQALGQTFQRSIVVVNCPDTQLILRFTAPKADYDTFNSDFRRSIGSWEWINGPTAASPAVASK